MRLRTPRRRRDRRRARARGARAATTSPTCSRAPRRCASAAAGSTNLVAERRRGLERELAAVADEGVVETLVAEAARTREQLRRGRRSTSRRSRRCAPRPRRPRRARPSCAPRTSRRSPPASCRSPRARAPPRPSSPTRSARSTTPTRGRARSRAISRRCEPSSPTVDAELATIEPSRAEADDARARRGRAARRGRRARPRSRPSSPTSRARCAPPKKPSSRPTPSGATRRPTRRAGGPAPRRSRSRSTATPPAADVAGARRHDRPARRSHRDRGRRRGRGRRRARRRAAGGRRRRRRRGARRGRAAQGRRRVGADARASATPTARRCCRRCPPGARRLASCVRSTHPALDRLLTRLLAPFVLVDDGWAAALDIGLAAPDVDRGRRAKATGSAARARGAPGRPVTSAVTPAALADAVEQARRGRARERGRGRSASRPHGSGSPRPGGPSCVATERDRRRRHELEDAHQARPPSCAARSTCGAASLDERHALLDAPRRAARRRAAARIPRAATPRPRACAAAEAALDEARGAGGDAAEQLAASRAEVEEAARARRRARASSSRSAAPAIDERRAGLARAPHRGRGAARGPARRGGARPGPPRRSSSTSATRSTRSPTRLARAGGRGRAARRAAAPPPPASSRRPRARPGRKLDGLRAERAAAEQQLAELRERVGRLEIEEAEIRLRLEQAVENVRREFDCEPDVAIAAPMPEVPDGTTLSARARELERELRLMGPINPLALVGVRSAASSGTSSCSSSSTTCATRGASSRA